MKWSEFLFIIMAGYLVYYGMNVIYDLALSGRVAEEDSGGEVLYFKEDEQPELIVYKEAAPEIERMPPPFVPKENRAQAVQGLSSGILSATGAVSLKELFNLAKNNLIEYTGTIRY